MASLAGERPALVIVAPDDPEAMRRHCREARQSNIPLLYDPSFQVTNMPGDHLIEAARGAQVLMLNDYEHGTFERKTGKEGAAIFDLVDMVVVTLGAEGSKILLRDGDEIHVPAAKVSDVVDPTGAGDAYRGGFAAGLVAGFDLEVCGRMGSVAAAYAVEHHGTQEHAYDKAGFAARYLDAFGTAIPS
ncbi:MAG: PfkB family carbohydrate kinase, partial [Acidobacteriota bacterium]